MGHDPTIPRCRHLSPIRWRSEAPDTSTCCPRSLKSRLISSVQFHLRDQRLPFAHVPWWQLGGLGSMWSTRFNPRDFIWHTLFCHVFCKDKVNREHSPTRRKWRELTSIKCGGKITQMHYRPNTLTWAHYTWGPSITTLSLLMPRGATRAFAWARVALPRVRATSTQCRRSRGSTWCYHVALRAMSHPRGSHAAPRQPAVPSEKIPLFAILKELKSK